MGQEAREVKEPLLGAQQPTEDAHAGENETDAASSPTGAMAVSVALLNVLPDKVAHSDQHAILSLRNAC